GLGRVYFQPPDGEPAKSEEPLSRTTRGRVTLLGLPDRYALGTALLRQYTGRAPGLIGVDQINEQLPPDTPEGCAVPLSVWGSETHSQTVTISIRRGGGQCTDQPLGRSGSLVFKRTFVSSAETPAAVTTARIDGRFEEAPESHLLKRPAYEHRP